mmetsp:Transcript_24260/g.35954  ORF Transcript_24260/g.35954 Transcript_24260/m.35954 type:complete len:262 (+) Transcript_24260:94-879(+)|eukprot:CAMPEP_0194216222 /NCGR_PEP_ID=MMETSP0156-20130528/18567_1 /TAXON_ID=33649 /ORGANISM="Thalassionema nitzschioides, Strain L26-B" /LENGTH=261 /DNA_ID=CAMNT_0038944937 /DNA_START=21 /DNA_END=806 /DNA_ORIENTATION=+
MMLLIVSGASRGFGQAVAVEFSKTNNASNLKAILTARSLEGLKKTKELMIAGKEHMEWDISLHTSDLGNMETLDNDLGEMVKAAKPFEQYDRIIIVNNAGSLGHLGEVAKMASVEELSRAVDLNITSSLWFTTRWVKELFSSTTHATIVNVSSLCAIQPFPTMTTYCTGKAARDMFHLSLAKESTQIKTLNYAPGAMATAMTDTLRTEEDLADEYKGFFRAADEKGELIEPSASAAKLVKFVYAGVFESGKHVDYWDLPEM